MINFVQSPKLLGMKAETLKLHIDIGYRSCSDLGNPMGAIKDQKGSPFKKQGPKMWAFYRPTMANLNILT